MGVSGKSTATSSTWIGLEYASRIPIPPRMSESTPVCPMWKAMIAPSSAMAS